MRENSGSQKLKMNKVDLLSAKKEKKRTLSSQNDQECIKQ
jgi:hypothetical protein